MPLAITNRLMAISASAGFAADYFPFVAGGCACAHNGAEKRKTKTRTIMPSLCFLNMFRDPFLQFLPIGRSQFRKIGAEFNGIAYVDMTDC